MLSSLSEFHPSNHNNLISHAVFNYTGYPHQHHVARVAATSSSLLRGSFVPNIISKIKIDNSFVRLVRLLSDPQLTTSMQFVQSLYLQPIDAAGSLEFGSSLLRALLKSTRYFSRSLRGLVLSTRLLTDDVLELVAAFVNLEHLDLSFVDAEQITDAGVSHLTKLTNLRTFKFPPYQNKIASSNGVAQITASCRNLTELTFDHCSEINDDCLEYISTLSKLTHLSLLNCTDVTDEGVIRCITHAVAPSPPARRSLTFLSLSSCSVTDKVVSEIASSLQNLTSLDLTRTMITDIGIAALVSPSSSSMKKKLGAGVVVVGPESDSFGTQLTSLRLGGCGRLSKESALRVCSSCTSLTTLDLSLFRPGVVDDDVLETVASALVQLTWLEMAGSLGITDAGMKKIASSLTKLRYLSLGGCNKLTNASLDDIALSLKNLEELNVSHILLITDGGIECVRELPLLRALHISSSGVTLRGVNKITRALPLLDVIT